MAEEGGSVKLVLPSEEAAFAKHGATPGHPIERVIRLHPFHANFARAHGIDPEASIVPPSDNPSGASEKAPKDDEDEDDDEEEGPSIADMFPADSSPAVAEVADTTPSTTRLARAQASALALLPGASGASVDTWDTRGAVVASLRSASGLSSGPWPAASTRVDVDDNNRNIDGIDAIGGVLNRASPPSGHWAPAVAACGPAVAGRWALAHELCMSFPLVGPACVSGGLRSLHIDASSGCGLAWGVAAFYAARYPRSIGARHEMLTAGPPGGDPSRSVSLAGGNSAALASLVPGTARQHVVVRTGPGARWGKQEATTVLGYIGRDSPVSLATVSWAREEFPTTVQQQQQQQQQQLHHHHHHNQQQQPASFPRDPTAVVTRVIVAMAALAEGGSLVVQVRVPLPREVRALLQVIVCRFERVWMCRPLCAHPASTEAWIVAVGYDAAATREDATAALERSSLPRHAASAEVLSDGNTAPAFGSYLSAASDLFADLSAAVAEAVISQASARALAQSAMPPPPLGQPISVAGSGSTRYAETAAALFARRFLSFPGRKRSRQQYQQPQLQLQPALKKKRAIDADPTVTGGGGGGSTAFAVASLPSDPNAPLHHSSARVSVTDDDVLGFHADAVRSGAGNKNSVSGTTTATSGRSASVKIGDQPSSPPPAVAVFPGAGEAVLLAGSIGPSMSKGMFGSIGGSAARPPVIPASSGSGVSAGAAVHDRIAWVSRLGAPVPFAVEGSVVPPGVTVAMLRAEDVEYTADIVCGPGDAGVTPPGDEPHTPGRGGTDAAETARNPALNDADVSSVVRDASVLSNASSSATLSGVSSISVSTGSVSSVSSSSEAGGGDSGSGLSSLARELTGVAVVEGSGHNNASAATAAATAAAAHQGLLLDASPRGWSPVPAMAADIYLCDAGLRTRLETLRQRARDIGVYRALGPTWGNIGSDCDADRDRGIRAAADRVVGASATFHGQLRPASVDGLIRACGAGSIAKGLAGANGPDGSPLTFVDMLSPAGDSSTSRSIATLLQGIAGTDSASAGATSRPVRGFRVGCRKEDWGEPLPCVTHLDPECHVPMTADTLTRLVSTFGGHLSVAAVDARGNEPFSSTGPQTPSSTLSPSMALHAPAAVALAMSSDWCAVALPPVGDPLRSHVAFACYAAGGKVGLWPRGDLFVVTSAGPRPGAAVPSSAAAAAAAAASSATTTNMCDRKPADGGPVSAPVGPQALLRHLLRAMEMGQSRRGLRGFMPERMILSDRRFCEYMTKRNDAIATAEIAAIEALLKACGDGK